jgi:4'-phosphopantetheinyl transferase
MMPPPGTIELWLAELDAGNPGACLSFLSDDERSRAAAFRFDIHRNRFIVTRAALRQLLSHCTGGAPENIAFVLGSDGKPYLAGGHPPQFNISHTEGHAVFALCADTEIGVDIERADRPVDIDAIADRIFNPRELDKMRELSAGISKPEAFYRMWVEHEARLKATGAGLGVPLSELATSLTVIHSEPWPGTFCAVATSLASPRLVHRRFDASGMSAPKPGQESVSR